MQQEATPQDQPWTQPARIAYTFNNDGPDSYAVDLAAKGIVPSQIDTGLFILGEITWNRNNQQSKQQNNLRASAGFHYETQSAPPAGNFDLNKLFSLWIDGKLGYNRKAVFADKKSAACVSNPVLPSCHTQSVGSIRGTIDFAPFWGFFESPQPHTISNPDGAATGKFEGKPLAYSTGFIGTLFYDNATENILNPDTAKRITGVVTGIKAKFGGAVSPRFTGYRAVLRGDVQGVWASSRAELREDDFDGATNLLTVSLDWDLSDRSFIKGEKGLKPSVGVTYSNGSDPLVGRKKQSMWVVGLKVAFN